MNYMSIIKYGVWFFAFCLATSCASQQEKDFQQLQSFFSEKVKYPLQPEHKAILILTEEGCPACNKIYADYLNKITPDSSVLILVTASGIMIDISPYLNSKNERVLLRPALNITSLPVENSGYILLNGNKIDTTVSLKAKMLESQLQYLTQHVNKEE